uniref:Small nuclear ribonucleoprotein n=1 Tax=Spironucleus salmonicida TaxID=348837 RepID=V6LH74_9EUKA|eukprot:EST43910.1 Small nuclear ribonucleoprotein [Spironucleus salmonicida]
MPFTILEQSLSKQTEICVYLRNNSQIKGIIKAFDKHFNLVFLECQVDNKKISNFFQRGDNVVMIQSICSSLYFNCQLDYSIVQIIQNLIHILLKLLQFLHSAFLRFFIFWSCNYFLFI